MKTATLSPELLRKIDAYWRAANYLSVGQIYLYENPMLKEPLKLSHVKPLVVGHWGTTPGQNFIYVHLNRVIKKYDLESISGAILYDETIRQQKKDGTPFAKALTDAGIIPGIKVDAGAKEMADWLRHV